LNYAIEIPLHLRFHRGSLRRDVIIDFIFFFEKPSYLVWENGDCVCHAAIEQARASILPAMKCSYT